MAIRQLIALFLIISTPAYADFDYLKKGDVAPYEGYIITPEREQSLRLMDKKLGLATDLNTSYSTQNALDSKTIDILNQRVDLYQRQNADMSKQLSEAKGDGFWQKTLYFSLGAVLTGLVAYGTVRAVK